MLVSTYFILAADEDWEVIMVLALFLEPLVCI